MLLSIQALLSAPNPDDPLANDVAEQWKSNEAQAIETGETARLRVMFMFKVNPVLILTLWHLNYFASSDQEYLSLNVNKAWF